MSFSEMHDGGHYIKAKFGAVSVLTAAGAGDATEVNGAWIDRMGYQSLTAYLTWTATLADTKTFSLTANLQDDTSSSGAATPADFGTAYSATAQATSSGGTTETGVLALHFDLVAARRYVRLQYTPDLNNTATDTGKVGLTYVLHGSDVLPPTA